jgi:acyl-coenzyme A synthetase/AMP-(fatty) acid ligase
MENTLTALVSILQENRIFEPTADARERATISGMPAYRALAAEAARDYEGFWARLARDGTVRDKDTGYFTIVGRIDDLLNVSGHRLGTMV